MSLISNKFTDFFEHLEHNNHKDWFHANKKDYELNVKGPFLNLVQHLLPHLRQLNPDIPMEAKKALFRINRDIRFSKDKSPYHLMLKAGFSSGGKKSELPGFYLGIDAKEIFVGGGLFMLNTSNFRNIRNGIAQDVETFEKIIYQPKFKATFGEIQGAKSKRIDKELKEVSANHPVILNKQFYVMSRMPLEDFYESKELIRICIEKFKLVQPMNTMLLKFLNTQ